MRLPILAGRRRGLLALLVLTGLTEAGALGVQAFAVRRLFDAALHADAAQAQPGGAVATFLAAAALTALLEVARRVLSEALGQNYTADLRSRLFEATLAEAALRPAERNGSGRLLPFVGDLSALRRWVGSGLGSLVVGGAAASVVLLIIALQSVAMSLAIGGVLAAGAATTIVLAKPVRRANDTLRRRRGGLTSFIGSRLEGAGAVIAMGRLERERRKVERRGRHMSQAAIARSSLVGTTRGIARGTAALMLLAALLVGAVEIAAGHLTAGAVVAITGLTGVLSLSVRDLGLAFELWHAAAAAQVQIDARLASQLPARRRVRRAGDTVLALERLRLGPSDRRASAEAGEGDVIRIAGSSPDAARVLAILSGLERPWSGHARVRGQALDAISPRRVARLVGYASDRAGLVRGSLGMNLGYRRSAKSEEIDRVVHLCGLEPLIDRLGGLGGEIRDGGSNLSPAERQAVLIARALVGSPPVLLLDRIDAYLPADTVERLCAALAAYPGAVLLADPGPHLADLATETWRVGRRGLRILGAAQSPAPEDPNPTSEPEACPT